MRGGGSDIECLAESRSLDRLLTLATTTRDVPRMTRPTDSTAVSSGFKAHARRWRRAVIATVRETLLVMLPHIMVCMDVWSKIALRSTFLL